MAQKQKQEQKSYLASPSCAINSNEIKCSHSP